MCESRIQLAFGAISVCGMRFLLIPLIEWQKSNHRREIQVLNRNSMGTRGKTRTVILSSDEWETEK